MWTVRRVGSLFVLASLVCVSSQRLVRRVSKNCRVAYEPKGREEDLLEKALGRTGQIYKANPHGCPSCSGMGYRGRVGIHELMVNSEQLTEAINNRVETAELKRIAMRGGMKTLHQDSMLKVKAGISTMEEVLAAVSPDMIVANAAVRPIASYA